MTSLKAQYAQVFWVTVGLQSAISSSFLCKWVNLQNQGDLSSLENIRKIFFTIKKFQPQFPDLQTNYPAWNEEIVI